MSNSRMSRSDSKSSKSYLHHPIEYRQVMRLRSDHHPQQQSPQEIAQRIKARQGKPSQSHLQRLINLNGTYSKSRAQKNASLSPPHLVNRYTLTPLNQLSSPYSKQKIQASSLSIAHRQDTSKTIVADVFDQQKLAIKQSQNNFNDEQLLMGEEIQKINSKVSKLVNRKLQITYESLSCKKNKQQFQSQKQQINLQLLQLIQEIKLLQSRTNQMTVLNQKISFIETLMAEQSTEAELMKKHYYHLSSNRLKGKIGDFNHLKTKVGDVYKSASHYEDKRRIKTQVYKKDEFAKKLLFKESTNKSSYKSPNKSDYESYRYRQKFTPLNLQPLPRSSYNRDYIYLKSLPDQKIINKDHSPYYPTNKLRVGSIYGQDYKNARAETINHRDLDAFKNKIKTLKISYMPSKLDSDAIDKKDYYKDVEETAKSRIRSNNSGRNYISQTQLNFNKKNLLSQSKRQYLGQKSYQPSRIKHQQLQSMQYQLKQLFKA